jgi:hypothetical protein
LDNGHEQRAGRPNKLNLLELQVLIGIVVEMVVNHMRHFVLSLSEWVQFLQLTGLGGVEQVVIEESDLGYWAWFGSCRSAFKKIVPKDHVLFQIQAAVLDHVLLYFDFAWEVLLLAVHDGRPKLTRLQSQHVGQHVGTHHGVHVAACVAEHDASRQVALIAEKRTLRVSQKSRKFIHL